MSYSLAKRETSQGRSLRGLVGCEKTHPLILEFRSPGEEDRGGGGERDGSGCNRSQLLGQRYMELRSLDLICYNLTYRYMKQRYIRIFQDNEKQNFNCSQWWWWSSGGGAPLVELRWWSNKTALSRLTMMLYNIHVTFNTNTTNLNFRITTEKMMMCEEKIQQEKPILFKDE